MSGPWRSFIDRSMKVALSGTSRVAGMQGVTDFSAPRLLYKYQSNEDIKQHVTGCDADIGGKSSVHLDLASDGRARFWGDMRLEVPIGKEESMRSGYAGFRSRLRTTLFGNMTDDLSLHNYLALRVRASGEPRTRLAYFVNIQTDGPVPSDIWQHKLHLSEEADGKTWEDVLIPFKAFVLTSGGEAATAQVEMGKNKVRTIGISILGGNARISGRYELGIDYIGAVAQPEDAEKLAALVSERFHTPDVLAHTHKRSTQPESTLTNTEHTHQCNCMALHPSRVLTSILLERRTKRQNNLERSKKSNGRTGQGFGHW
ncbi:CIA30-domain-containing protein [Clavulina sp. PMI_390]|nr:CIA30-domain-containing protein [Clavulina sp. PMI_390]